MQCHSPITATITWNTQIWKQQLKYFISSSVNGDRVASECSQHDVPLSESYESGCGFAIKKTKTTKKWVFDVWLNAFILQIQKREVKICTLMKELAESKGQHSECQKEVKKNISFIFHDYC